MPEEYSSIIAIVLFLIIVLYLVYESYSRRPRKTVYVVRELLVCVKCNYRVEKDFEPGDFIGLVKGKCPQCGEDLKLKGIYAVERGKL